MVARKKPMMEKEPTTRAGMAADMKKDAAMAKAMGKSKAPAKPAAKGGRPMPPWLGK
jgi:hypothetical protein